MLSLSLFMVKELVLWALLGIVAAAIWVVPLIDLLYKLQFTAQHLAMPNKINAEWMKIHGNTTGTPSLGGILIWITVPVLLLSVFWAIPLMRAIGFIVLIVGLYGLIDGILDVVKKNDVKFREFQNSFEWRVGKLLVSLIMNVAVALLIVNVAGVKSFDFFGISFAIDNVIGIAFLSVVASVFTYATEIIDGIDGLSSGMYIITLLGFVLLMLALPAQFLTSAATSAISGVGVYLGVLIVYLYFNIPPARFYMGGPGAMPMGAVFLLLGLFGNVVPALLVLMVPYLLDLATSFIQLFSIKFLNRKVFKIAPVHHHFEAIGWPSPKVVMRFWLFNIVTIFLALAVQLFI